MAEKKVFEFVFEFVNLNNIDIFVDVLAVNFDFAFYNDLDAIISCVQFIKNQPLKGGEKCA